MPFAQLKAQAADFAPSLLAIQEEPPARLPRVVLYVVGLLFAILLGWAVWGQVDIVASAEGRLVPKTFTKIVQPAEGGIVREILVHEGQAVAEGQVLLRMDATQAGADLATLQHEAATKALTLRRIDAELQGVHQAGARLDRQPQDPSALYAQVASQYQAHVQAYRDALAQERTSLLRAQHELQGAQQTWDKLQATVPLYQQTAQSYDKLVKEGFVSEQGANDKLREKIEKEQELKAQTSAVAALQAALAQSNAKLAQITSSYQSQLMNERADTQAQAQKAAGELAKQSFKSALLELRAPQAGLVKDLGPTTVGSVVQPGAVLAAIVPQAEALVAEVSVKNEDVGFVQSGQVARVKLSAYPFQKYGLIDGTVSHVGADSNAEAAKQGQAQNPQQPQQNYKAFVTLSAQSLQAPSASGQAQALKLTAGMAVVAEIHQGRRSVMEYLLAPVQKVGQEAARER